MKVPFARPDITEAEISAVTDAMRNGWITSGPKMKQFEQDLSDYVGGKNHAVAVNSATAGLHLALQALGVRKGDEVLVPTLTFTATAEVVRYLGATPVLVDINPSTLNINILDAEQKITKKTRAVMPVHFAGLPVDMAQIWPMADFYRLKVVEDAAHAIGAKYRGRRIGDSDSDAVVFSFYATKCLTTGEGGAILSRHAHVKKSGDILRLHGIDRDAFARYTSSVPSWQYDVVDVGYKYNMTDMAAAMGIEQLKREEQMRFRRTEIANRYDNELAGCGWLPPIPVTPGTTHAWHLYTLQVKNRDRVIQRLFDAGVGCSVHFRPLHMMTQWADPSKFPHADVYFEHCISLPLYSAMTDDQVDYVIEQVKLATHA